MERQPSSCGSSKKRSNGMKNPSRAMYVGTFDPLTNGHFDIISRACELFDTLVIAVGHNHDKQMLFSPEQREQMIVQTCKQLPNVRTTTFSASCGTCTSRKRHGYGKRTTNRSRLHLRNADGYDEPHALPRP